MRKSKKALALMLGATMSLSMFAGCGEAGGGDATTAAATEAKTEAATEAEKTEAETEAATEAETEAATEAATSGGKKVGIAMPTKSLERWNRDGSYLEEQFKSKGYEVKLTFSDNKIDQQVKDIEGLIADDVDLLVIAAIDGESLTQVLAEAKEEKKATAKKAPAKKAAPKKTAPKKPVEAKVEFFVEYAGAQVAVADVINNVKATYGKDAKKIAVYLKPEEGKAYFVADDEPMEMDVFFC